MRYLIICGHSREPRGARRRARRREPATGISCSSSAIWSATAPSRTRSSTHPRARPARGHPRQPRQGRLRPRGRQQLQPRRARSRRSGRSRRSRPTTAVPARAARRPRRPSTSTSRSATARPSTRTTTSSMPTTRCARSERAARPVCLFGHTHLPVVFHYENEMFDGFVPEPDEETTSPCGRGAVSDQRRFRGAAARRRPARGVWASTTEELR